MAPPRRAWLGAAARAALLASAALFGCKGNKTALPVIGAFSASPTVLPAGGGSVTLSWQVSNATALSLAPGDADGRPATVTGSARTVTVTTATTFTLTATNAHGAVSRTAMVMVAGSTPPPPSAMGPLRVHPTNRRYFADGNGKPVVLAGMHTWNNLQDVAGLAFDYTAYLGALKTQGHNFIRLWAMEEARGALDSDVHPNADVAPSPFQRPGPDNALDGKPKFDVTLLNQAYFDRLRARVWEARAQGIYVSVMLFNGWSLGKKAPSVPSNPWLGHPLNAANNVNGLNGDPNGDSNGWEVETLALPAITAVQETYVRKVIETVNDLDNVLYEISNEAETSSTAWQTHMIDLIHATEAKLPLQHPVGMTAQYYDSFQPAYHSVLLDSPAEWISPGRYTGVAGEDNFTNPAVATGAKVILADTDHLCGLCADADMTWKNFARGNNFLYMDVYDQSFLTGPRDLASIRNMGAIVDYGRRMDLAAVTPQGALSSTRYCLAKPGAEYLIYAPAGGAFTVELGAAAGKTFAVEWLNPANGNRTTGAAVSGGGTASLTPPFGGAAVAYLKAEH